MEILSTELPDVLLFEPKRHADKRGFFSEVWHQDRYREAGVQANMVQDNLSCSSQKGTIRGLHCQVAPFAQAKLVHVLKGAIYDVAVDVRVGSPTFGKSVGFELSEENGRQLYIPEGFLHGFVTLEETCIVSYKCSQYYHPESDRSVAYNDPTLSVQWPELAIDFTLSDKDRNAPFLSDIAPLFTYGEAS